MRRAGELETRLQEDQATRNRLSREIGQRSAKGERPAPELLAEMASSEGAGEAGRGGSRELQQRLDALPADVPQRAGRRRAGRPGREPQCRAAALGEPARTSTSRRCRTRSWGQRWAWTSRAPPSCRARGSWCCGASSRPWSGRWASSCCRCRPREHGYTEVAVPLSGPRRGDVRHRPAAQVRRRSVPHHQRPLADPDRRGLAHQSRRRRDPRRGARCRCGSPRSRPASGSRPGPPARTPRA